MVLVGLFFCMEKLQESMRGMELWGKSDWGLEIIVLERCPWEEKLPWAFLLCKQIEEKVNYEEKKEVSVTSTTHYNYEKDNH